MKPNSVARQPGRGRDELRQRMPTRESDGCLLTVREVQQHLAASRDVVEGLIMNGALAAIDVSPAAGRRRHRRMLRVRSEDLQEFLDARKVRVTPAAPRSSRKARRADGIVEFV